MADTRADVCACVHRIGGGTLGMVVRSGFARDGEGGSIGGYDGLFTAEKERMRACPSTQQQHGVSQSREWSCWLVQPYAVVTGVEI